MASQTPQLGRFGFKLNTSLQQLLDQACSCPDVPQELKAQLQAASSEGVVPWRLVQQACALTSAQQPQPQQQQQPSAASVCAGSTLALPSPPARQRSQQLQQRLAKLQEQLDSKSYAAMVADVTQEEQAAAAVRDDPFFPTTKLQLSFGLHVIVTMGTFFALGYYGGHFLLRSQSWAALCGCLGLVAGLLLETTLLILRVNMPEPLDRKYAHLLDKSWQQSSDGPKQQQGGKGQALKQQQQGGKGQGGEDGGSGGAGAGVQQGDSSQQGSKQPLRRRRAA